MIFLSQKLQTNTMKHRISRRVKFALSKTEVSPDTVQHHVQTLVPGETGKVESIYVDGLERGEDDIHMYNINIHVDI